DIPPSTRSPEHKVPPSTSPSQALKATNTMELILQDIQHSNSQIEGKISEINSSISSLDRKVEVFTKRLDTTERRISDAEDMIQNLEANISHLQEEIVKIQGKTEDLENRSQRCNLWTVGLPKGVEGKDPVAFLEDWLPTFLNLPEMTGKLEIERAHSTFMPRPKDSERPRMLLFKLLRFRDKEIILRQARNVGPLRYKNKQIYFFLDMSADLYQKCKSFSEVKRMCKDLEIPFALLYPARFQVDFKGQCLFFTSPSDMENHIKIALLREKDDLPPREQRTRPSSRSE
uniref:L1 transposable element RRM domain-containing protein n=1 Tax=Latimeria chalumnae TaxID=7897 RepID=H3AMJ2_LATCH